LEQLGAAFKDAEKPLQRRISAALRKAGAQIAADVPRIGAEKMPQRGGLAARLAAARGGVTVSLASKRVSVSIRAKTREGYALRKIDQGQVRHPVYGNKSSWVVQPVPAHAFTDAFTEESPKAQKAMRDAVHLALQDIAREGT
jgi:hypothetical protein